MNEQGNNTNGVQTKSTKQITTAEQVVKDYTLYNKEEVLTSSLRERFAKIAKINDYKTEITAEEVSKAIVNLVISGLLKSLSVGNIYATSDALRIESDADMALVIPNLKTFGVEVGANTHGYTFIVNSESALLTLTKKDRTVLAERENKIETELNAIMNTAFFMMKQGRTVELDMTRKVNETSVFTGDVFTTEIPIFTSEEIALLMDVLNAQYKAYLSPSNKLIIKGI